jgi:hypothetical protein
VKAVGDVPRISTVWAMPSKWTFSIAPIAAFLARHLDGCDVIVDPFCGKSTIATHRNDICDGGVDAEEYCQSLIVRGVCADAVIFDPPYSPTQLARSYRESGRKVTTQDTQNGALYSRVRTPLRELLRPGGVALSFGWQSSGFGKDWRTTEILLVQHGGAHSDTICVAQVKPTVADYAPLFAGKAKQEDEPL